jgi:PKHD-type hydroxylase
MRYNWLYWYFPSAIPPETCDKIINLGLNSNPRTGVVSQMDHNNLSKADKKFLFKIRKSNVAFLNDKWIQDMVYEYVKIANREAGWNFDLVDSESPQFTIYNKNHFYDWHVDNDVVRPESKLIRKLSAVINLSDPKDYKGGILEFCEIRPPNRKIVELKALEFLPRGSLIVFTSYVWHRVTPVTKGLRYSLVNWVRGEHFR